MDNIESWYYQLTKVKEYLIDQDPKLKEIFDTIDASGFKLHTVIKEPYTALLGAIIGQKISYINARKLRGELYKRYSILTPFEIEKEDLSFLGINTARIIKDVTRYIIQNNVDLNTQEGIRTLTQVSGIGPWTIDTTLLTCLKNWDLFPEGDKFLQKRLERLYGRSYDINEIIKKWAPYRSVVTWYLWRWF